MSSYTYCRATMPLNLTIDDGICRESKYKGMHMRLSLEMEELSNVHSKKIHFFLQQKKE